jgi:hypothetical protein
MLLTSQERATLIERYAKGPALLKNAFSKVPQDAVQWRPGPGRWSAHEVVVHCADAESNAALRIRYLLAEDQPVIQGYDQARWAERLDYHDQPVDVALATVEAVRAHTVPLLRRMGEEQWRRTGHHTELGHYDAEQWLAVYAEHLEKHAGQIDRNLAAWKAR